MKTWIVVSALLLTTPALAGQSVDEVRPAADDARVHFSAVTGDYTLVGVDGASEIRVSGTLGDDVEEMRITGDERRWHIELVPVNRRGWRGGSGSRLTIEIPAGAELTAGTVSADIQARGLYGEALSLNSVSGDITVDDSRPERMELESVSGNVTGGRGGARETRLKTVSGNARADGVAGRVTATSVSGSITIDGQAVSSAQFETVSGGVRANLAPESGARLEAKSHSGVVELTLPRGTPVDVRASTFSGRISSDFGEPVSGRGPGQRLEYRQGNDPVRIELQSFSGRIRLSEGAH